MHEEIDFGILGSMRVRLHGNLSVQWTGRRRERQLLAALLTRPGRLVPFDTVVDWVWGEREKAPQDPAATLSTHGGRVRAALRDCGLAVQLDIVDGRIRLRVDRERIDHHVFRRLVAEAKEASARGEHERAHAGLLEAIGLWADEPLAELDTEPARDWRQEVIRHDWLPANTLLVEQEVRLRRYDDALRRLDELLREHGPLRELGKKRIAVLRAAHRHGEADEYYLALHRTLREEGDHDGADDLRRFHDDHRPRNAVPARSVPAPEPPRQLPRAVSDFTGREELFAELDHLVGIGSGAPQPTVVALVGAAGFGKTAAVVQWAHRVARQFPAGAVFADLHGFAERGPAPPTEVVDTLLASLGSPAEHVAGPVRRARHLRALLADRTVLVVLDNARNSAHVRPLLPLLDRCVVLVTSRRRFSELAVEHGIRSLTVGPLSDPQAEALLAERIGARCAREPAAVAELVRMCGGMPLALGLAAERAAARANVRLADLAGQLRDRRTLLGIGTEGDGPHRSLEAVFALSFEALTVEAGRVFTLLGAHPGAEFGVEVVAALAGEDRAAARARLDELVSAHLIEQPAEIDRYRMHDLVHAYAASLAAADPERRAAMSRMFDFYLRCASNARGAVLPHTDPLPLPEPVPGSEPMTFADERRAVQWCLRERANLEAATDCAFRQRWYGIAWRLPHATAEIFGRCGYSAAAAAGLEVAREAAKADGDDLAEAASLNDLGYYLLDLGEVTAATTRFRDALAILDRCGHPLGELTVLVNVAATHHRSGDLDEAERLYRECLRKAQRLENPERVATVEHRLGGICHERGRRDDAIGHFARALRIREELGDAGGQVETLAELAAVLRAHGRRERAESSARRALALLERGENVAARARLFVIAAELREDAGELGEAAEYARRAAETARPAGQADAEAEALDALGRVEAKLGERDRAAAAWHRCAEIHHGRGRSGKAREVERRLAEIAAVETDLVLPHARDLGRTGVADPASQVPGDA
ncbi:ATP/maltotriose-dependent transcriptional regulator MalT [Prauserella shujinwangii]|uniref:ATP/maltotriose-dependent transcriptional regulator MalT n=1 Tax=Prauserella shujinwangii TaxID=1453103 RepID=A0A2T0LL12_9PSEU|nr:tetratricopeptide repeat protein [Prauserella shujinwangii]PRX43633.1 ATP/maltotriose-dependent transcriptional regulator MalT [Prauserella shujinwangii]